jgi:hypothetical protein
VVVVGDWVVVVGAWVAVVGDWVVVVGAWVVAGGVSSEPVVEPPPLGWVGLGGAGRHCKDSRSSRDNRTSLSGSTGNHNHWVGASAVANQRLILSY